MSFGVHLKAHRLWLSSRWEFQVRPAWSTSWKIISWSTSVLRLPAEPLKPAAMAWELPGSFLSVMSFMLFLWDKHQEEKEIMSSLEWLLPGLVKAFTQTVDFYFVVRVLFCLRYTEVSISSSSMFCPDVAGRLNTASMHKSPSVAAVSPVSSV